MVFVLQKQAKMKRNKLRFASKPKLKKSEKGNPSLGFDPPQSPERWQELWLCKINKSRDVRRPFPSKNKTIESGNFQLYNLSL
jgi:hypothetical protein